MREFKGSKGPWEVVGAGFNNQGTYYTLNIDWISKYNADLISAAPDLLEALQEVLYELSTAREVHDGTIRQADEAIAKALGK